MVLGTMTLIFGSVHAMCFLFLNLNPFNLAQITVPLLPGGLVRHSLGIIGLEMMLTVAFTAGIYRWTSYRRWVWLHRLAYPAVGLTAVHSWFGAMANGNLAILWLGGLTLLVPTVTLAALRFAPPRLLMRVGLAEEEV
jgi:sulfoxide reductase heme-binding subunit YedZ